VPVLSLPYAELVRSAGNPVDVDLLGQFLLEAAGAGYVALHGESGLLEFLQLGATYLFDLASSVGRPQEDRTVAAWAVTPPQVDARDRSYQRGFPMTPDLESPVDRGHLIPHQSGGEFGPNIFRQDRRLNQGTSDQGKRYRALEREAAATPGMFFFGHLLYGDDTAYPIGIELALLRGQGLNVERFDNRPDVQAR
jgi:hypothetical protein